MDTFPIDLSEKKLRRTGIDFIGDFRWGTHFCQFYETKQDLLDTLIPFFRTGLVDNELCLWIVSPPLTKDEVLAAFRQEVPEAESRMAAGDIEFHLHDEWYFHGSAFNSSQGLNRWRQKLDEAMRRGYAGLRLHGDDAWLTDRDWKDFLAFEHKLNDEIANERVLILCTYPLAVRKGNDVFDVARAHEFALARRHGRWEALESPELQKTKSALATVMNELDVRVQNQTRELKLANENLKAEIAERERSERKIKERDVELHTLLENVPAGVLKCDENGFIQYFNPVASELWGRVPTIGDPKSRYCGSFRIFEIDGTHVPHNENPVADVLRSGAPVRDRELVLERPDGRKLNVLVNLAPIKDEHGHLKGAVSCMLDISERKRAEEALHGREEELRTIIENAPDAIVRYDRQLRRIFANPAMIEAFGLPKEAILGGVAGSLASVGGLKVSPEQANLIRNSVKAVFETGKPREFEIKWRPESGERAFHVRMKPEFGAHGSVESVLAVGRDITNLQQAEQALREAQAELAEVARFTTMGELAASIAHEVNQPLAAVVTDADAASHWLAANPPNLDEARESIRRIVRNGNRASDVIARIRGLLKRTEHFKQPVDLNELIEESIGLLRAEIIRSRVTLETDLMKKLPLVSADRVQLQQVVINLLVNAIDSLKAVANRPRTLKIKTEPFEKRAIRVIVQDSGTGIAREHSDRLFQPFFTTKAHGLGMGLPISRSIVEAHGGRLWAIANESVGATFQFSLPVQNGSAA